MHVGKYYVSVTGLLVKNWLAAPKFIYISSRAYHAALKAEGNVYSTTFSKDGVQHTITVWESKAAMQKFMRGEAHMTCMKNLSAVSSYAKAHGFFADEMPPAEEAIKKWKFEGRRVYGEPNADFGDPPAKPC